MKRQRYDNFENAKKQVGEGQYVKQFGEEMTCGKFERLITDHTCTQSSERHLLVDNLFEMQFRSRQGLVSWLQYNWCC